MELNPLDMNHTRSRISNEKVTKGIQKPHQRSRSRSLKKTPIFPGREQRDDIYPAKQSAALHSPDMNIPPRSPSRKSSNPVKEVRKKSFCTGEMGTSIFDEQLTLN